MTFYERTLLYDTVKKARSVVLLYSGLEKISSSATRHLTSYVEGSEETSSGSWHRG